MLVNCEWNDSSRTLQLTRDARDARGSLGHGRSVRVVLGSDLKAKTVELNGPVTRVQL